MSNPARTVYIVDDDESHLSSMGRLLRAHGHRVECFSSAAELLARLPSRGPGCIIADLKMPGMDGIQLQRTLAQSQNPLPIVFLTGHGDIPASVTAMRLGAEDFLVKTAPAKDLLDAVDRALVRDSRERCERARKHEMQARFDRLTRREQEVLTYVVRGRPNKQIAAALGISERSVKRHRTSLMRKIEVESVAELVRLTTDAGML